MSTETMMMVPENGTIDHTNAAEAKTRVQFVKRSKINVDWERNPRLTAKYSADKIGWLARNIYDNGLLDPITVSKRTDGTFWLLKGHLRLAAILIVVNTGLPAIKAAEGREPKDAVPASPDFMEEIRCVVLEGLSHSEELDILMDHGTVTVLDRREKYRAVKTMAVEGFTQQKVADKMKMSRGAIQKLVNIARMPSCVEEVFMSEDENSPELNDTTNTELFKAFTEDMNDGYVNEPGPKFTARFEKFVKDGKTRRTPPLGFEKLQVMAQIHKDADLTDLLLAIGNGNQEAAANAIARLKLRMVPVGFVAPSVGDEVTVTEGNITNVVGVV